MAQEKISKLGVLIADPSQNMVSLVASMLRSVGKHDIREATDFDRLQFEAGHRVFDIIIVDDAPGVMDGVAFTRQLRAATESPNRLTPIIMMSAAPEAKRIAEARDAGATEFLRKPFAASHLQSRLASIEASPRGFIEAPKFNGPDRRRKTVDVGDERRVVAEAASVSDPA